MPAAAPRSVCPVDARASIVVRSINVRSSARGLSLWRTAVKCQRWEEGAPQSGQSRLQGQPAKKSATSLANSAGFSHLWHLTAVLHHDKPRALDRTLIDLTTIEARASTGQTDRGAAAGIGGPRLGA